MAGGPQFIVWKISRKLYKTRMHSSRMCTVRSSSRPMEGGCLPGVCLTGGGVCPGGVFAWGCLPGQGVVCLDGRSGQGLCAWMEGPARGCLLRGWGVCPGGVCPGWCLPRVGVSVQEVCLPGGVCLARGLCAWMGGPARGCQPMGLSVQRMGVSTQGGICHGGGVCPGGGVCLGGSLPRGGVYQTPPVDRITDACENITLPQLYYRLGTVNLNMVNSKFHLIQSCCKYFARFLSFHV